VSDNGRNQDERQGNRIVTGCMGVLFVALAIAIIVVVDRPIGLGALVAAMMTGLLGIDALIAAARARRSLLSRVGPLP
jgi:hypothetical protein